MQKGLVSLLTPMYNMEHYVHRLLESVLKQTYPNIEMIVIDDGSSDQSGRVVESYKSRFENKGYQLKCIYQENGGQSAAISNGLKLITGEFLAWPDADDYYATDDAIEKMVNVFRSSKDTFQMVRTQGVHVEDGSLRQIGFIGQNAPEDDSVNMFEDALFIRNGFYYCSGAYLVSVKALYETTNYDIYTSKDAGQNWQLLLPMFYKYHCHTIRQPLYCVVERAQSHSRGFESDYHGALRLYNEYFRTQMETLKRIKDLPITKIEAYKAQLEESYNNELLIIAIKGNLRSVAKERIQLYPTTFDNQIERVVTFSLLKIKGGTYILNFLRYLVLGSKKRIHKLINRK